MNPRTGSRVRPEADFFDPDFDERPPMSADSTSVRERLGRQVKDSEALRPRSLPLAVLASVVGTMLASAYGTDRLGTLLSAATGPVLTALFTTQGRMKARSVGITAVTCVAVALTMTGFTVPELILGGRALLADRNGTFVPTEGGSTSGSSPSGGSHRSPSTPAGGGPAIATSASTLTCDQAAVGGTGSCPSLRVRSVGPADLRITGVEVAGGAAGEFRTAADCPDPLPRGASCEISVEFRPAGAGLRQAVLVVHQNLPGPATRVTVRGVGRDEGGSPSPDGSGGPTAEPGDG